MAPVGLGHGSSAACGPTSSRRAHRGGGRDSPRAETAADHLPDVCMVVTTGGGGGQRRHAAAGGGEGLRRRSGSRAGGGRGGSSRSDWARHRGGGAFETRPGGGNPPGGRPRIGGRAGDLSYSNEHGHWWPRHVVTWWRWGGPPGGKVHQILFSKLTAFRPRGPALTRTGWPAMTHCVSGGGGGGRTDPRLMPNEQRRTTTLERLYHSAKYLIRPPGGPTRREGARVRHY